MDCSRLLTLLDALEEEIAGGYDDRLTALIQAYTSQKANPSSDFSADIEKSNKDLEEYLLVSAVNDFVPSWLHMMEAIGASRLFGKGALIEVQEATNVTSFGPAPVLAKLEEFQSELKEFRKVANQTRNRLTGLGIEPDVLEGQTHEIGVIIPTTITKNELGVLNKQLAEWNKILRSLSELAGDDEREVKIRRIATGGFEMYVAATYLTAVMLGKVIVGITNYYEQILRIRHLRIQMAKEGLPSAELKQAEAHEKGLVENCVKQVVKEVLELAPPEKAANRHPELHIHLEKSVRRIAVLIDNGVLVEVSHPEPEAEEIPEPKEVDSKGQPVPPEKIAAAKARAQQLRANKEKELKELKAQGAAVARLPKTDKPIFLLTEGSLEPPDEPEDKDEPKKPNK